MFKRWSNAGTYKWGTPERSYRLLMSSKSSALLEWSSSSGYLCAKQKPEHEVLWLQPRRAGRNDGQVRLIDIQYLNSLAALSTIPQANRMRRDFEGLYGVLTRLVRKAVLPSQHIEPLVELHLNEVFDLSAARERFQGAFGAPAKPQPVAPAVPEGPQQLAARFRALLAEPRLPEPLP